MSRMPNDDLFEGTKMTFGEHLEELRVALYRGLIGLVLGTLIGLLIAHRIVQAIQGPLKSALDRYYLERATEDLQARYQQNTPPELLALVTAEGLMPTTIRLEAAGIVTSLKAADPEQFANLRFIPYRFVAADFRNGNCVEFCRRLRDDGLENDQSPGSRLWKLLSDGQRMEVVRIADLPMPNDDDRKTVVAILNQLAASLDIYKSPEFEHVDGSPQVFVQRFNPIVWLNSFFKTSDRYKQSVTGTVKSLREELAEAEEDRKPIDLDKLRRLNKLLLASAYSDVLMPARLMVVDVPAWKPTEIRVQALQAEEPFMIWMKAAFITGFVISSPWIFFQIWSFVAAGLYPHEKWYVYLYLPFSLALFLAGTALAFFFVFEPVLDFLFSFNRLMDIDPDPRISSWLSFVLFLPIGFGIAFQLPLVMLFLCRIGIFTVESYLEKWRIAILVIFVVSMVLTPADPISMLLMALPLTVLFFLGVLLCKWMPRGRKPFDEAYEP